MFCLPSYSVSLGYFVKIFVCCACCLFGLHTEVMHCIMLLYILYCWWFVVYTIFAWHLKSLFIYPACCFGLILTENSIISTLSAVSLASSMNVTLATSHHGYNRNTHLGVLIECWHVDHLWHAWKVWCVMTLDIIKWHFNM